MKSKAPSAHSHRALLMVNGDCGESALLHCQQLNSDLLIAADGGLRHFLALGLQPDVLIGDLDSAAPVEIAGLQYADTRVIRHQTEKDQTDLELALEYTQQEKVTQLTVAGISGGRTDQMLCNWLLLGQCRWGFSIDTVDDSGCGYLVVADRSRRISVQPGVTISLLSMTPDVAGLSTAGLKYPLANASLPLGSSLGISNVALADEVTISISEGVLLVYVNNTH